MILKLLGAFIVGVVLVGSSIQRTLYVDRAQMGLSLISSVINSISYFLCVYYISKDDYASYAMTSVGAIVVIIYLVIARKKELAGGKGT